MVLQTSERIRKNRQVGERDAEGMRAILRLAFFEGFQHKGRLAAVFELMKCNLRTALAKYGAGPSLAEDRAIVSN